MSAEFDQDGLISIFVLEASDGLRALSQALQPGEGEAPSAESLRAQFIIAHRIKGAAYQYGFTTLAALGDELERALEHLGEGEGKGNGEDAAPPWDELVGRLRDLVRRMEHELDAISAATPSEDGEPVPRELAPAVTDAQVPLADDYVLPDLDEEVMEYFVPEAQEYLDTIEKALLTLEGAAPDADTIQTLFRTAHTLKGSAYTVGFAIIGDIAHPLEDLMGAIRDGQQQITPDRLDLIFQAVDVLRLLMPRDHARLPQLREKVPALLAALRAGVTGEATGPHPETATSGDPAPHAPDTAPRLEADAGPAPDPRAEPPRTETGAEAAGISRGGAGPTADDAAVVRVSHDRLERLLNLVGELVTGRGRLDQRLKTLESLAQQVMFNRQRMLDTVRTFENKYEFTMPTEDAGAKEWEGVDLPTLADFGALEFDKYDDFNILARRLAEVTADVNEAMSQLDGSIRRAREDMTHLQRLTTIMRDEIARTRMVPIGTPFLRFRRAVRELARSTGKEVTLITSGEQTEVDTTIVDRLVDPLIHMVRNAVYHGIEPPDVRVANGKPAVGLISLRAAYHGNRVLIEVQDDGAGLDVDKIKARAVALGLIDSLAAARMSREEIINLVFLPTMSTAEAVGRTAGRGIGMDVVKRAVESVNGRITVQTESGRGTTFTLELPLTLLVSTALMVRVADQQYAVPLPSIREVVMPVAGELETSGARATLQLADETIEVDALRTLLHDRPTRPDEALPVVIARTPSGPRGLAVDELLGRQEIVIKGFGPLKALQQSCFAGATVDPEGRVVLVLDVARATAQRGLAAASFQAAPARPPRSGSGLADGEDAARANARILLIDDSLSIRKFVGRMLEAAGYEVDTAVDGEDGLRKIAATRYGLILTDLEMPKVNGYEVLQALRVRPASRAIPVLVMTTRAGEKHRQAALQMGASSYVTKPVEERALIDEVSRWVGHEARVAR